MRKSNLPCGRVWASVVVLTGNWLGNPKLAPGHVWAGMVVLTGNWLGKPRLKKVVPSGSSPENQNTSLPRFHACWPVCPLCCVCCNSFSYMRTRVFGIPTRSIGQWPQWISRDFYELKSFGLSSYGDLSLLTVRQSLLKVSGHIL